MSVMCRKSLGAVRFETSDNSPSSTGSPNRRRRSMAALKVVETNIEENDDEAERLARREQNESGSPVGTTKNDRRQSTFGLSAISNLSASEMSNQIAQCIKLSAENKINDKNAFQLKMIDFLVYTLKKQDPNMSNLQLASASLDASAKIYGFRVDKVHSELLKILGVSKQDKRDHQDENNDNVDADQLDPKKSEEHQKKKKKKNVQHMISTCEAVDGDVETTDYLSLIIDDVDTQTSDMLIQAAFPQHANQGTAINHYNDVVLDTVPPGKDKSSKIAIYFVEEFTHCNLSPSFTDFKYLDWSPDNEPEDTHNQIEENNGEYHFDLDAVVPDNDFNDNDIMMDCGDAYEERCDRLAQKNQHIQNIVDFHDIIANNPNPNATYEYSYLQRSYRIHWAGPSHWKITFHRNLGGSRIVETCKQNARKKKKDIELNYTEDSKEENKLKCGHMNRLTKLLIKTTKLVWSEEKITYPQDVHYDLKRYCIFFNKPTEHLKFSDNKRVEEGENAYNSEINYDCDDHDISNFDGDDNFRDNNIEDRFTQEQNPPFTQETVASQSQGGFIGDNLVSIPKLTDKILIPYSQRAKKIDMRQLKHAMLKLLKKNINEMEKENFDISQAITQENETNKDIDPKAFSNVYLEVSKMLPKTNAESLSPAIAFISLLHLANEKNFEMDRDSELTDLTIRSGKMIV